MWNITLWLLCLPTFLAADIISHTGSINFKSRMEGGVDMTLTQTGLGVGVTPSSNLDIQGNALISGQTTFGAGLSQHSTLNLHGTLSFGVELVSSNTTLSANTLVSVDSSDNDVFLNLPSAADTIGRTYIIKKVSRTGNVFVNGNLIDGERYVYLEDGQRGALQVCSMAAEQWSILTLSGNGALWLPTQVSCNIWLDALDASSIQEVSNVVSQWDDKSGNDNHAVQTNAGKQATYDPDNQEVDFDGGDIFQVSNDAFHSMQNPCVVAITRFDSSSTWNNAIASYCGENNLGWQLRQRAGNQSHLTFTLRTTGGNDDPTPATTTNSVDFIAVGYRKNTDTRIIRHNGTEIDSINGTDTGNITYGSGLSGIGGRYRGTAEANSEGYLNGSIKEIVVADGLSDTEIEQLEGYMAWRWNMQTQLPSTHPYRHEPPKP